MAVLGEYDPCFAHPYTRGPYGQRGLETNAVKEMPLWEALDTIAKRFDLDWEHHSGWIWIRSPRTLLSWSGEIDLSPPEPEPADEDGVTETRDD